MKREDRPESDEPVLELRPRPPRRRRPDAQESPPASVADLLAPMLGRLGLKTRAREVQVRLAWPEVVGEAVAAETRPAHFDRGRLTVETSSPPLSHQLHLQRQTIIDGLNAHLKERVVRDIRFRLAPGPPRLGR